MQSFASNRGYLHPQPRRGNLKYINLNPPEKRREREHTRALATVVSRNNEIAVR